jgi:hypothetical protein
MIKENIISQVELKSIPFHRSDIFEIIFPESKGLKIKEFKINTVGNSVYN